MTDMGMPKVMGLNKDEYDECLRLYEYYNCLNLIKGVPFPVDNVDKLSRDESLEYYWGMRDAYEIYMMVLGYRMSDKN